MQQPYLDEVDESTLSLLYQRYASGILTHLRLRMDAHAKNLRNTFSYNFPADASQSLRQFIYVNWSPDNRTIAVGEYGSNSHLSDVKVWVALP